MAGRVSARRRQESSRSSESLTPADELSSWLGDDVCANCGAPARASHLYCSQQCKDEDAKDTSGVTSTSAPAHVVASQAPYHQVPGAPVEASQDGKFRYACPPSPNILAKYNPALTSPALIALERSLPTAASINTNNTQTSTQSVSSSADSSTAARRKANRRSSSRSTFSSASDILSTEGSTPSPASHAVNSEEDNLDDVEPTDLCLPPSIHPAASILLNSTAREAARTSATTSSSITPDGSKRSPIANNTSGPAYKGVPLKKEDRKTIDFARRPSSTNLPPPVLFTSPILSTTTVKANAAHASNLDFQRRSSGHGPSPPQVNATPARKMTEARRPRIAAAPYSSPAAVHGHTGTNVCSAVPVAEKQRDRSRALNRKTSDSPPQLASASSSAGKTLRAVSPLDQSSPGLYPNVVCGRYGCGGLGSSAESVEAEAEARRGSAPSQRTSFARGHKHTHSAAAGLNFFDHATTGGNQGLAAKSKLIMTPVDALKMKEIGKKISEQACDLEERVRSPVRGRSKARGQRSTSRRSPSPPRGAARRGRSEDLLSTTMATRDSEDTAFSVSPASSRSNPIAVSHGERRRELSTAVDSRRGRSPTERAIKDHGRGRQPIDKAWAAEEEKQLLHACEMAWPAYGHHQHEWENEKSQIATAIVHGTNGYDDVDLDEL